MRDILAAGPNNLFLVGYFLIYLWDVIFLGSWVLKALHFTLNGSLEKRVYQFALGNLIFSIIFHYLGIFHLLYGQIILLLYVIPLFFLARKLFAMKLSINPLAAIQNFLRRRWETGEYLILLFLLLIFGPLIPHLFVFPTSWDPLAYHLMLPKVFLRDHYFSFYGWLPNTVNPVGIESLFSLGEIVRDPRLGNFINFSFLMALVVYVIYGLRYLFPRRLLLVVVFLFAFKQILFSQVTTTPFVDFPLSFYTFLIAMTLYKYIKAQKWQYLLLVLVFSAFTFLVKYVTGFVIIFAVLVVLGVHTIFNFPQFKKMVGGITKLQRRLFIVSLAVAITPVVYWLWRNFSYTANPIFPFFNPFWNSFHPVFNFDVEEYKGQMADSRTGQIYINTLRLIKHGFPVSLPPMSEMLSSASLLFFSLLGIFNKERPIRYLAAFGLIAAAVVYAIMGFPSYRYNLGAASVMALVSSVVFFGLFKRPFNWIKLPLVLAFIFSVFTQFYYTTKVESEFFFNNSKTALQMAVNYREAIKGMFAQDNYKNIDYVNRYLDKDKDKILVMFDNRLYYFDIPAEFAVQSKSNIFADPNTKDATEVYEDIKKRGITHLFVNNNWGVYPSLRKDIYDSFVENYLQPVSTASGTIVYKVK